MITSNNSKHRRVSVVVVLTLALYSILAFSKEYPTKEDGLSPSRLNAGHYALAVGRIRFHVDLFPKTVLNPPNETSLLHTQCCNDRNNDEFVPFWVAESSAVPILSVALNIEADNVISNGRGLAITNTKFLNENPEFDNPTMTAALQAYYGARQIVFLDPLENEPTGHVDMFATFPSPNCLVVGQYNSRDDSVNAGVLNRNARCLADVRVGRANLQVRRKPMHQS